MTPTAARLALLHHGYQPIPCEGKRPPLKGWQEKTHTTPEEIKLWESMWHLARNTGILCARSPALDIDILNPAAAAAIEDMARSRYGEHGNIMVRIGKAPKRAILFRTDEPFPKIVGNVTG